MSAGLRGHLSNGYLLSVRKFVTVRKCPDLTSRCFDNNVVKIAIINDIGLFRLGKLLCFMECVREKPVWHFKTCYFVINNHTYYKHGYLALGLKGWNGLYMYRASKSIVKSFGLPFIDFMKIGEKSYSIQIWESTLIEKNIYLVHIFES